MSAEGKREELLAVAAGILEEAFFSPLTRGDLLGFRFGVSGLLGLEDEETFDLFVRSAFAAEAIFPEAAAGRTPLAWVMGLSEPAPVLAQVLASLRADRPFLFHRAIASLSAVEAGHLDPDDFELLEDFLQKALEEESDLVAAAGDEHQLLASRALWTLGRHQDPPDPRVSELARAALDHPDLRRAQSDAELLARLRLGAGLAEAPDELAPAVLVEAWRRFTGAILGTVPDLALLANLLPELAISAEELALHAPADRRLAPEARALCPYCGQPARMSLGESVRKLAGCEHFIYMAPATRPISCKWWGASRWAPISSP